VIIMPHITHYDL